jgi:branched-chain amino acid aminotransferase
MGFEQSKWVWMNGKLIPWSRASIHVSVHALHYGSGVFEGVRCYQTDDGPSVFRLDDHLNRLYASAEVYGLEIPYTLEELAEATCELILRNEFSGCYVRHICFFGSAGLGLNPRQCPVEVAILAWPWAPYLGVEGQQRGVRVTVSPWVKFDSRMLPTTAKACGQYLNSILAVRDAVARGYDEALLLDASGHIAEGSGENLFIVREGQLLTNDEHDSILMGITRDSVIEIARDLGYSIHIKTLRLDELLTADEAFFTGTATEIAPVCAVDGRIVGNGSPGPITTQIQSVFFAAVAGREPGYKRWLTHIKASEEVLV